MLILVSLYSSVLDPRINFTEHESAESTANGIQESPREVLTPYDMKRLESYTNNLADYHLVR